jgi:hypothetical protein
MNITIFIESSPDPTQVVDMVDSSDDFEKVTGVKVREVNL